MFRSSIKFSAAKLCVSYEKCEANSLMSLYYSDMLFLQKKPDKYRCKCV